MRRDPKRLADVGANASAEERLLGSLIADHRQARPAADGLREIAKRAEALAPRAGAASGRGSRFTLFGVTVAVCAALAVVGLRVTSVSTAPPAQRSAPSVDARSEPPHVAAPAPSDAPGPAHEDVPFNVRPSESTSASARPPTTPVKAAAGAPSTRRANAAPTARSCDESELIDRAETLLRTGQASSALEVTRLHTACTQTILDQERERIAIEALVLLGRNQEATTRARAFEVSYPSSPHVRRVRQLVGLATE